MNILLVYAFVEELADFNPPPNITHCATGLGVVEASIAVTAALARQTFELIMNVGIGGGFDGVPIGSQILVENEYFWDLAREDGSAISLPPGGAIVSHVPMFPQATPAHSRTDATFSFLRGDAVCSSTITTSEQRALAIRTRYPSACVESMEGFAVARCAQRFGVPIIELRGISNRVGDRERANWDFRAGAQAARALLESTLLGM